MRLRVLLFFLALWTISFAGDNDSNQNGVTTKSPAKKSTASISPQESHKNNNNSGNTTTTTTTKSKMKPPSSGFTLDSEMIQRALYVLIGITAIGVLYFLVRAVRLKKTTVQRKKYGLLSNYDDTMEMGNLESDEDDTVYEANSMRR